MIREATAAPTGIGMHLARTMLGQAGVIALFMGLIPLLLMHLHWQLGIPALAFHPQRPLAMVIGIVAGALYLYSALTLAIVGRGTPLPFEAPRRLVVAGPYRVTRNPMTIGAMGQLIALLLYGGSWLLAGYALLALVWWAFVARPRESTVMIERFGRAYEAYRRAVPLVIPRLTPWQPIDDAPARAIVAEGVDRAMHRSRRRR